MSFPGKFMTVIVAIIQIIKIFLENQTLSRWTELDDFRKANKQKEAKKNLLQPPLGCGYQASEDFFFLFKDLYTSRLHKSQVKCRWVQ